MTDPAARPTLFFILNYGSTAVRNVIRGGVLAELLKKNYRVVLFELSESNQKIAKELYGDRIVIENLGPIPYRGLPKLLQRLRTYEWRTRVAYRALLKVHNKEPHWRHIWQNWLGRLIGLIPFPFWERLMDRFSHWPEGEALFERYQPRAVLICNPVAPENKVISVAKKKGLYTACCLESWDNLCVHGAMFGYANDLLVWNPLIASQAVRLHRFPRHRVHPMGIPSFDLYAHPENYPSEAVWRREVGLPATGPIVVYTTSARHIHDQEDQVIDRLLRAREEGRLPQEMHVLVRLHPQDTFSLYDRYETTPGISIQYPDTTIIDATGNDVSYGRPLMLAATMRHAAVVLNVFSTICLDALTNGTPVVVITFDAYPVGPEKSVKKYTLLEHIKELLTFDAVSVANNFDEMIHHTRTCLENKSHLLENRNRLLAAEVFNLEGTAARNIAGFIDQRIIDRHGTG